MLLTCRQLYSAVLPRLYRKFEWEAHRTRSSSGGDHVLLQMLDQDNAGLQHIRKLVLRDHDEFRYSGENINPYPEAALLVYSLPNNVLRSFEYVAYPRMVSLRGLT